MQSVRSCFDWTRGGGLGTSRAADDVSFGGHWVQGGRNGEFCFRFVDYAQNLHQERKCYCHFNAVVANLNVRRCQKTERHRMKTKTERKDRILGLHHLVTGAIDVAVDVGKVHESIAGIDRINAKKMLGRRRIFTLQDQT